jgi:hypothetical protein
MGAKRKKRRRDLPFKKFPVFRLEEPFLCAQEERFVLGASDGHHCLFWKGPSLL